MNDVTIMNSRNQSGIERSTKPRTKMPICPQQWSWLYPPHAGQIFTAEILRNTGDEDGSKTADGQEAEADGCDLPLARFIRESELGEDQDRPERSSPGRRCRL